VVHEQQQRADPRHRIQQGVLLRTESQRQHPHRGHEIPRAVGVDTADEQAERDEREGPDERVAPGEAAVVEQ
jgi:hypothetical protein